MSYTPEQIAENRRIWVEALRSGKYQQVRTKLYRRGEGMCCLGVACDVIGPKVGLEWDEDPVMPSIGGYQNSAPPEVHLALGMDSFGKLSSPIFGAFDLAALNDSAGYTFAQIADVIESGNLKPWGGE